MTPYRISHSHRLDGFTDSANNSLVGVLSLRPAFEKEGVTTFNA